MNWQHPAPVFPGINRRVLANDGDALHFCSTCAFSQVCLSEGMDKHALSQLHVLVEHVGPLHSGERIFREGDSFDTIAAVRSGTVKTCQVESNGHERVLGFYLPGEVIGFNGIYGERYPCDALALDTVMLCRFSFPKMALLAAQLPNLQRHLFRLMSRDIGVAALFGGGHSADERVAAFLLGISQRLAARGFSAQRFQLSMSRVDIANYLQLVPETISRVLRRFKQQQWLQIQQRDVEITNMVALKTLASRILREA